MTFCHLMPPTYRNDPHPPCDCLGRYSRGRFKKILDKLVLGLPRQHATSEKLRTCSVLTTASDTTEIDEIVMVGMVKPHRMFKIIVGSKAIGTIFAVCRRSLLQCQLVALREQGSFYYNYKQFHSVVTRPTDVAE